jgi:hypothetical protein
MNHVPETSQQWIIQLTMAGEPKGLSLDSLEPDQSPVYYVGLPGSFTSCPCQSTVCFIPYHST